MPESKTVFVKNELEWCDLKRYFKYDIDEVAMIKTILFGHYELGILPIYNITELGKILSQDIPINIALDDPGWDDSAISEVDCGNWSNTIFVNPNQFKMEIGIYDTICY